jgi:excisionase family DNA binding protein
MTHNEILTIADVAQLLKIGEKTLYVLVQRGEIPGFKVGGQWRFSRAAIDSWIESRSKTPSRAESPSGQPSLKKTPPASRTKSRSTR